jgi:guanylate kinase
MEKLREILKSSSLASSMSDMEIDEVVEEIKPDFDEFLEEEKERIKDEIYDEYEIVEMKDDVKRLKKEVEDLEKTSFPKSSLEDVITGEWAVNNWEWIKKLEKLNKNGKEILRLVKYAETLEEIGSEAAPEISKMIDEKITQDVLTMDANYVLENVLSIDANYMLENILLDELKKVDSHRRIILVGKAASGKDHARKVLESRGFKYAVSFTTRPPRVGEENGKDYFFLTEEEFKGMIERDEFYEYVTFNNWYYGTSSQQFYEDHIFIMTPYGLSKVDSEDRKKSFVIFFDIDESLRRERLLLRSDADSVDRRIIADEADFQNFTDFDIRITNSNF